MAGFLAVRLYLAVCFGVTKIRPPSWLAKWPPTKKLAGFLAVRLYLAVCFGVTKIRPPSWLAKWPQKTVRVMDRFVLPASNTNLKKAHTTNIIKSLAP
ncbi:hypothetical protein BpHYR1_023258 [Brachionus plicatilis]|uniref:Uncharacterized protein n=1 Tax=Brachionus plicatilis TaxID=10195 RepID=A0A3M7RUJ8_BRAPC|nr:hypothetical protein BpHYR1_023258 [Brachionus plicatilis]